MYIYHPCLLGKAQNSQPCSSCGLPSFRRPLPFGLRGFLKISRAFAVAQLTPWNHNRFSSVSGLGTRRCTADSDSTIPSAVALGQKGELFVMGFPSSSPCGKSGLLPLSPSPGLSYRAETTLLNKLAFLSTTTGRFCPRCHISVCFLYLLLVTIYYHVDVETSRKKSCEWRFLPLLQNEEAAVTVISKPSRLLPFQHSRKKLLSTRLMPLSSRLLPMVRTTSASSADSTNSTPWPSRTQSR